MNGKLVIQEELDELLDLLYIAQEWEQTMDMEVFTEEDKNLARKRVSKLQTEFKIVEEMLHECVLTNKDVK